MAKLPDFVQNKIANEIFSGLERLEEAHESRNYLGMSGVGRPCAREQWYNFRGFSPLTIEGRILLLFRLGDRIEEEVVYGLKLAGYKIEGQQDAFQDFNGFFRGHCDGIIHGITSRPHILEVKSANDKKFKMFQKNGVKSTYPVYFYQAQCYMGYSGLERCLFVVYNKNTSEIYTERVYFYPEEFEFIKNRAMMITNSNLPPEMINNKFECEWCSHRINCKFPENAIMSNRVCGNCHYVNFKECKSWCCHPDHFFQIQKWGISCPDWIDMFHKGEIPKKKRSVIDE